MICGDGVWTARALVRPRQQSGQPRYGGLPCAVKSEKGYFLLSSFQKVPVALKEIMGL